MCLVIFPGCPKGDRATVNDGGQDGGQDGTQDAASDDGGLALDAGDLAVDAEDGGMDGGDPLPVHYWGDCPFPYTALAKHLLVDDLEQEYQVPEVHVRCLVQFDELDAQVFVKARPTGVELVNFSYEAYEAYLCRDGSVEHLPAGSFLFEMHHHRWMDMEFAFGDRRYSFNWSEVCKGARPCTPDFDQFDVRRLDDASLLAEHVPTICAEVGPNGVPQPLVQQLRVPSQGDFVAFPMGSEEGEVDESPLHVFTMRMVRMDQHEATWRDLSWFLNDQGNQCEPGPCVDVFASGNHLVETDGLWTVEPGFELFPAVGLSWYGADAYCRWRRMRLPYESDWEMAASAVGTRLYPWGDGVPSCDRALFAECLQGAPVPVCSLTEGQSADGLCDLAGNVAEWMALDYQADFYSSCCADYTCPGDAEFSGEEKNVRGGGWLSDAEYLRASSRQNEAPGVFRVDLGLRCVSNNPTSRSPCEDDASRPHPDLSSCLEIPEE